MHITENQLKIGRQIVYIFLIVVFLIELAFSQEKTKLVLVRSGSGFIAQQVPVDSTARHRAILTWSPNADSVTKGYYAFIGTASGDYTFFQNVLHPNARQEFWELSEGKTYYFAVSAYSENNVFSDLSNEVSLTIAAPLIPGTPQQIHVEQLKDMKSLDKALREYLNRSQFKILPVSEK